MCKVSFLPVISNIHIAGEWSIFFQIIENGLWVLVVKPTLNLPNITARFILGISHTVRLFSIMKKKLYKTSILPYIKETSIHQ